ncbi:cupin domain-containing protein [Halomarina oriensis]|uniref:Cupin domain-containing protein n=1 Tax=Halomarina oriensis TaxID=671145 RepID=A0A6B0GGF0_9EURY|nr:cupin domain-containing protein [Halomarina oriensis]MWG33590.1 cupin domain-containing protein [Halomarina oriensis]
MDYSIVQTDEVDVVDLSTVEEIPPDHDMRPIDEALGAEEMKVKLWYIDPGEEIQYHAHDQQEELFYVMAGTFSVKVGKSGEEEYREIGPGTFYRAGPRIGHGHRNVGDEQGVVLALGAPAVDDPGLNPHALDE